MFVFVDIRLLRDIRNTMATTVPVADNLADELARLQKELHLIKSINCYELDIIFHIFVRNRLHYGNYKN